MVDKIIGSCIRKELLCEPKLGRLGLKVKKALVNFCLFKTELKTCNICFIS